jgi:hypothetical protein
MMENNAAFDRRLVHLVVAARGVSIGVAERDVESISVDGSMLSTCQWAVIDSRHNSAARFCVEYRVLTLIRTSTLPFNPLENRGRRDSFDERRVMVDLTPAGRAIEVAVRSVTDQIVSACRLSDLDAEVLRQTLETLVDFA